MPYLVSAVVLVGAVGLLNLVLTYGVIRRLREHTELLAGQSDDAPSTLPTVGATVGAFTATTTSGRVLSTVDLAEGTAVGFFRTGCPPCAERLPQFIDYARRRDEPERHLAVLIGDAADLAEEIRQLTPVSQVVMAERESDVVRAFEVTGFPTLVRLGAGQVIEASGWLIPVLEAAAPELVS